MGLYYCKNEIIKENVKELKIRGTKTLDVPIWMINYYIKSTCDNYTKLMYLFKILEIYSGNNTDIVDIGISTGSIPIDEDGVFFEEKLLEIVRSGNDYEKSKYCLLSETDKSKNFWYYMNSCERPVCFAVARGGNPILLHNPRSEFGIKVRDISYHSPIDIVLSGIGEGLEHLINAGASVRNDARLQEEHEARMVTQSLLTMQAAINVGELLQNTNLPGSHKEYYMSMYNGIMAKQEKLNEKIGIVRCGIDERI